MSEPGRDPIEKDDEAYRDIMAAASSFPREELRPEGRPRTEPGASVNAGALLDLLASVVARRGPEARCEVPASTLDALADGIRALVAERDAIQARLDATTDYFVRAVRELSERPNASIWWSDHSMSPFINECERFHGSRIARE